MMRAMALSSLLVAGVVGQPLHQNSARTPQQRISALTYHRRESPFVVHAGYDGSRVPLGYTTPFRAQRQVIHAETEVAAAQKPFTFINVFEETLEGCVEKADMPRGEICEFRTAADLLHDVCVAKEGYWSQDMTWDDTVKAECISIWSFKGKYIGKGKAPVSSGYDNIPKCSALPAGVLDSQYTVDMWRGEELKVREFGVDGGAAVGSGELTSATTKFRSVIESICEVCALQAPSERAKADVMSKCEALRADPLAVQARRPYVPEIKPKINEKRIIEVDEETQKAIDAEGGFVSVYEKKLDTCYRETVVLGTVAERRNDYCTWASDKDGEKAICAAEVAKTEPNTWTEDTTRAQVTRCIPFAEFANIWAAATAKISKGKPKAVPKCSSLPAAVLESDFTLNSYAARFEGMQKFRFAIETLCEACAEQATSEPEKESIRSKCDAIRKSAPVAELAHDPHVTRVSTVVLIALMGSGALFAMFRSGLSTSTTSEEPFLMA